MPYKGGVQLLPDTPGRPSFSSYTSGNNFFWTGIGMAIAFLVVGALLSAYAASVRDSIASLEGQLAQLEKTRDRTQEQALIAAGQQSTVMKLLMADKIYWTQALTQMERMTQSSVQFTNLVGSVEQASIVFSGIADSYATVARQLAAFTQGTGIKDALVNSAKSTTQGTIQFEGSMHIDNKALLNATPAPKK